VCLDTETGGLDKSDALMSLAMVQLDADLCETGTYETLVQDPGRNINDEAVKKNGLSPLQIAAEGLPVGIVMAHAAIALDGAIVAAHNAPFDLGFLDERGYHANVYLDTMDIFAVQFPGKRKGLTAACQHLGIDTSNEHNALADSKRVAALLRAYRSLGINLEDRIRK
jgi:DNA polymerase III epsilon subunit-like protein